MFMNHNARETVIDDWQWCCWNDGSSRVSSIGYVSLMKEYNLLVLTVLDTIKVRMQLSRRARQPGVSPVGLTRLPDDD